MPLGSIHSIRRKEGRKEGWKEEIAYLEGRQNLRSMGFMKGKSSEVVWGRSNYSPLGASRL